jgi:hypothetical protein
MRYTPEDGVLQTGTMWFWHGVIAMVTPVLLVLATRWMQKSFKD